MRRCGLLRTLPMGVVNTNVHTPSVVVADEDVVICDLVTLVLSDEGFQVTAVYDVSTLGEAAAVAQPDVVILSVKSHYDRPAWAAASWLHHLHNPIPVVMLTADESLQDVIGTPAGEAFASLVTMPFDLDELVAKVKEAAARQPHSTNCLA